MVQKSGLHHLLSMKPYEKWDILYINWCRISSINSIAEKYVFVEWMMVPGRRMPPVDMNWSWSTGCSCRLYSWEVPLKVDSY